ncbi:hypothetical protein BVC80_9047g28 [Macleaya cordata]|uniref:Uncharacterized protein n=1 Tax=Macleaya cordata TaxID=56857 RepID=A0A200R2Z1_MACCD|nr:hypothetical protein BVC80_9047g28 [Macleaya cordata]
MEEQRISSTLVLFQLSTISGIFCEKNGGYLSPHAAASTSASAGVFLSKYRRHSPGIS